MATREELIAQAKEKYRQYLINQAKQKFEEGQSSQEPGIFDKAKNATLTGLGVAGKALDYAGGVARTAGAYPFVKKVTGQDVLNALKANPLTGEQILEKAGAPQGGSLSDVLPSLYSDTGEGLPLQKGGAFDPTKRGAQGLALEMATDPLALASFGTAKVAQTALKTGRPLTTAEKVLQVVTRPVGYGLEEAGKARYASALRKVDKAAQNAGQYPVSPVFLQQGMPVGNFTELENAAANIQNQVGQQIGNIRKEAAKKGATVNMLPALEDAMNQASVWRHSPHPDVQSAAQKLDDITASYLGKGDKVPVDQAAQWATEANDLGKKVFGVTQAPLSAEGNVAIGQGLKKEVTKGIESVSPEIKDQYRLANFQYSSLAGEPAQKQLAGLAKTEASKHGISAVDYILGGAGVTGAVAGHPASVAPLVLKKTGEFLNSPYGRTATGKATYNLGRYGDQLLRRPSVWQDLYNQKLEEQNK